MKPCPTSWCGTGKQPVVDVRAIAQEITEAIRAECAPGKTPTPELMLRAFCDAYELYGLSPSACEHQHIAARVGALMSSA
jgi:hypothetical protein